MHQSLQLNGTFDRGDELTIVGKILQTEKVNFYVDLRNFKNEANFHFNPRLYRTLFWGPRLVMNNMENGKWMEEENITPFYMNVHEAFTLKIKNGTRGFEVDLSNGFRYCFKHRTDDPVEAAWIIGHIQVLKVEHLKGR